MQNVWAKFMVVSTRCNFVIFLPIIFIKFITSSKYSVRILISISNENFERFSITFLSGKSRANRFAFGHYLTNKSKVDEVVFRSKKNLLRSSGL